MMKSPITYGMDYVKACLMSMDSAFKASLFGVCTLMVLFAPDMSAMAGAAFNEALCKAVDLVTSGAGKAIATAAIITIAIGALLGRVSWGMAVMIAAGIAGTFAAPQIAEQIAGAKGDFCG